MRSFASNWNPRACVLAGMKSLVLIAALAGCGGKQTTGTGSGSDEPPGVVADTHPGRPDVDGWSSTTLRSTSGLVRQVAGTASGGGSLGAELSHYRKA